MSKEKKVDKLHEFCVECEKQGISYAEAQRREWLEQEKKKKEILERAKKRELERKMREALD